MLIENPNPSNSPPLHPPPEGTDAMSPSPSPKAVSVFFSVGSTVLPEMKSSPLLIDCAGLTESNSIDASSSSTKIPSSLSPEIDLVAETKPGVIQEESAKVEHDEPVSREWRRGKVLGWGAFGLVHMAMVTEPRAPRFKDFPPVMAVKTSHEPFRAQLENEKLILRLLRGCPYVIQYLGEDEIFAEDRTSRLYLFLELASGGTLHGLIKASKGQPLEASVVRRHTRSVLAGLKRIHDEGYVHCSLNSENILLVEEGHKMVAKLADFSLVKQAGEQRHARGSFAPEGWTLGVQEKPADIWSLGCVVLQMLGGRMQGMMQFLRPVLPKGLSQEAVDFLGKCLATKPEDRATVEELISHPFVCPDKAKKGGQRRRMQWKGCLFPSST